MFLFGCPGVCCPAFFKMCRDEEIVRAKADLSHFFKGPLDLLWHPARQLIGNICYMLHCIVPFVHI